jgi:glycosyltransferase involved in cell wall biosynthesis
MFIPASARLADAIVAISMNTAQDLLEILPASKDKLHVVHLAPSLNRSYEVRKCRLPVEGSYALVVAHLTRNKNIETVVKAARILQQNGIGCRVCVAGRDSQGLLAKAIKDNSAQDCVVVCGEVSDQVLCDLYENAICLVHASLYEGFGLPALEAQAMGAPLVCSNGGALPEVAGDGAIYFNPRDPEELAQIIGRLTDRPDERRHWRERGAENLRRFSWEKTAEGMERIFNDVLKGNRAPKAL